MRFLIKGRLRVSILIAVAIGLTAGGIAYASIPERMARSTAVT
jgi:hypothetical protein